jgi:hypothetical protein
MSMTAVPSLVVFCPQSRAPQEAYLDELRPFISSNRYLKELAEEIKCLGNTWDVLASHREDIVNLRQGRAHLQALSDWIAEGPSKPISNVMSGILSLPLLVIIQIAQYIQLLQLSGKTHAEFLSVWSEEGGCGPQGYCAGLLPAFAIASSKDEEELAVLATRSMRIALAIGVYGELADDGEQTGPTTVVVRLKYVGQGDDLVKRFPGVSTDAINAPKTFTAKILRLTFQQLRTQKQSALSVHQILSSNCPYRLERKV